MISINVINRNDRNNRNDGNNINTNIKLVQALGGRERDQGFVT